MAGHEEEAGSGEAVTEVPHSAPKNPILRLIEIAREGFSRGWDPLDAKDRLDEIQFIADLVGPAPKPIAPNTITAEEYDELDLAVTSSAQAGLHRLAYLISISLQSISEYDRAMRMWDESLRKADESKKAGGSGALQVWTCVWCGEAKPSDATDAMKAHGETCTKSPFAETLRQCQDHNVKMDERIMVLIRALRRANGDADYCFVCSQTPSTGHAETCPLHEPTR